MTEKKAWELLAPRLTAFYGYAYTRVSDKNLAEDAVSEIICEIVSSSGRLKNDSAFWGFAWKTAEHTLFRFNRRYSLEQQELTVSEETDFRQNISAEDLVMQQEEAAESLYLLRRELSFLSGRYREICIAYYLDRKSCGEIAEEQKISIDMTKYYLSKARNMIRGGFTMTRKLGEKSYRPGIFTLDFWGDCNHYASLFKRRLPGSIVLAAYEKPLSAEELSMELGVSMPYMEDEIDILEAAGVLRKIGKTYQTNLIILTGQLKTAWEKQCTTVFAPAFDTIFEKVKALLPDIRALSFSGNDFDDNRLLIGMFNLALMEAFSRAEERAPKKPIPRLPLGCHGWIFGYDRDGTSHHYYGITLHTKNRAQDTWFSAVNYRIFFNVNFLSHSDFSDMTEALCDAIREKTPDKTNPVLPALVEHGFLTSDGLHLHPNFPVFDAETYRALCTLLDDVISLAADCMCKVSAEEETLLKRMVPASVRDQCGDIAKIHSRLDLPAYFMEKMIADGKLRIPAEQTPLCIFGVRNADQNPVSSSEN